MLKEERKNIVNYFLIKLNFCFLFIFISKLKNLFDIKCFNYIHWDFLGLILLCPGLLILENWKCFNQIIANSAEDKISLKAALEISPSYFLKAKNKKTTFKNKNRS